MLINNQFIYLPIPKNASTSIIYSILHWKIKVDFGDENLNKLMSYQMDDYHFEHFHNIHSYYIDKFPNKKIIGIKRPSVDRFLSAIKYMIYRCKIEGVKLKYDFENLNENEIIEIFSNLFYYINKLEIPNYKNEIEINRFIFKSKELIKNYLSEDSNFNRMYLDNFRSQYFWGLNKCDIIININELDKFVSLIQEIKPNFNLIKINTADDINLKINKTENLINFIQNHIDLKHL